MAIGITVRGLLRSAALSVPPIRRLHQRAIRADQLARDLAALRTERDSLARTAEGLAKELARARNERDSVAFDEDSYPRRPKILFIGWPESSHTHSWIDLLEGASINVRLFALESAIPPAGWQVRTYITKVSPPNVEDTAWRRYLLRQHQAEAAPANRWDTILEALASVIEGWKPDIVHTLGFDAASYLYLEVRRRFGERAGATWIAQARGGPDLTLHQHSPDYLPRILGVFQECDHFLADSEQNYSYARSAGLPEAKISSPHLGVVSGPGGIDVDGLSQTWSLPPSKRERLIVWPKTYETISSKALPVFEAILLAWDRIQPCRFEMLWLVQTDVKIWFNKMIPAEIKSSCQLRGRIPRDDVLKLLSQARVMLAPALTDGIPNSMMEAMACGAFPIVSPLDTITPVVQAERHVLFARNLYPEEIAQALVRAMSDDVLVDAAAATNVGRVRELADRNQVRRRAIAYYEEIAGRSRVKT